MNKIMSQINDIPIWERRPKLTCVLRRSHIISITPIVTLHEWLKIHTGCLFSGAMLKFQKQYSEALLKGIAEQFKQVRKKRPSCKMWKVYCH